MQTEQHLASVETENTTNLNLKIINPEKIFEEKPDYIGSHSYILIGRSAFPDPSVLQGCVTYMQAYSSDPRAEGIAPYFDINSSFSLSDQRKSQPDKGCYSATRTIKVAKELACLGITSQVIPPDDEESRLALECDGYQFILALGPEATEYRRGMKISENKWVSLHFYGTLLPPNNTFELENMLIAHAKAIGHCIQALCREDGKKMPPTQISYKPPYYELTGSEPVRTVDIPITYTPPEILPVTSQPPEPLQEVMEPASPSEQIESDDESITVTIDGNSYRLSKKVLFGNASLIVRKNDEAQLRIARNLVRAYHQFERTFRSFIGPAWDDSLLYETEVAYPIYSPVLWMGKGATAAGAHYRASSPGLKDYTLRTTLDENLLNIEDDFSARALGIHEFLHEYARTWYKDHPLIEEGATTLLATAAALFKTPDMDKWDINSKELHDVLVGSYSIEYSKSALTMLELAKRMRHSFRTFARAFLEPESNFIREIGNRFAPIGREMEKEKAGRKIVDALEKYLSAGKKEQAVRYVRKLQMPDATDTIFRSPI